MPPKKNLIPLDNIFSLRFIDKNGRVFVLDHGRIRGEYILREVTKKEDEDNGSKTS